MAHIAPPLPPDETDRLAALEDLGILDTEPEPEFDRLVQLATIICRAPIGAITFVDSNRQWFKSRVGVDVTATPRDVAFCAYTIAESDRLLEVRDAASMPVIRCRPAKGARWARSASWTWRHALSPPRSVKRCPSSRTQSARS